MAYRRTRSPDNPDAIILNRTATAFEFCLHVSGGGQIHPEGTFYTWFDYRGAMFQRKQGLRIDHILASRAMASSLQDMQVDYDTRALERPSDHAPVWAQFADCASSS